MKIYATNNIGRTLVPIWSLGGKKENQLSSLANGKEGILIYNKYNLNELMKYMVYLYKII